ncbi:MAG: AAA family ATPase, partial [Chloroflexi bacterium]|nr:AAA family ATPase [Chloroflexota bacterium]
MAREHLAFLFWPDSSEKQARTNIRNLLHQLRRGLPESEKYLHITRGSVRWREDAPYWLDVTAFETALAQAEAYPPVREEAVRRAEALYQGQLLPHLYDDWVLSARERLHQRLMQALIMLVEDLEAEHKLLPAITFTQHLLRLDPLREETYRLLMQLYGENGNKTGVVQTYQSCEKILNHELGVEPSVDTRQTYHRLLNGDFQQPLPSANGRTPHLIGREKAWRKLYDAWQRAKRGHLQVVMLSGPAGVGKSRLAQELAKKVQLQGIGVANARAYKSGVKSFCAAVVDLFQSETLQNRVHDLDDVWLHEITRLMPAWSEGRGQLMEVETDVGGMQILRQRLFEALARACIGNRQPILLHIDDIHWGDSETLAWLHYLLRYDATAPLLIVLTARPEDTAQRKALQALLRGAQSEHLLIEIPLDPLDEEETGALMTELLGRSPSEEERHFLYSETEGNPLFIVEMVTMGLQSGNWDLHGKEPKLSPTASLPSKLQAVIETRLSQLSPVAQELAGLGSVFGREFSLTLLQQTCSHDEETMVQAIDELCQRHIVQEVGSNAYYFTHGKLRAVAYASLSRARRQLWHRLIAETLETSHGHNPHFASQIARHFRSASEEERAVPYDLMAGDANRMIEAYEEAAEHYMCALAVLEKSGDYESSMRTLNKLGLVYHLAAHYERSDEVYARAFFLDKQLRYGSQAADWSSRTLRTAMIDPVYADPGRDNGGDAWLIDQLFSGLMTVNHDMDVVPDVAQSWQVCTKGCVYTFHLRKDVIWSDGEPLKANDFLCAWKRLLAPDSISPYASLLYDIQGARAFQQGDSHREELRGVRVLDDHTLEVSLEHPNSDFLYIMAHRATFPVPAHVVAHRGDEWTNAATIVGNGPFLLSEWKPGERLQLVRNPAYHGVRHGNVARVNVTLLDNWSGQTPLFEADELDIVSAHNLPAREVLHLMRRQIFHEIVVPELSVSYVTFNTRKPPFNDRRVRLAFVLATDRQRLASMLLDKYNLPVTGGFLPPGLAGHVPDLALPHDPDRARELLAEAGYPAGAGLPILQSIEGKRANIWRATSTLLREQWQRHLGVRVETKRVSKIEVLEHLYGDQPPHLCFLGWRADYPTPNNFLRIT